MRGWLTISSTKRGFTRLAEVSGSAPPGEFDEIRLLAPRFWRLAAQRRGRKHGSELALREEAGTAQRADWLRPHADRGIEFERHQRRGSDIPRCVVDSGSAGCGHRAD